MVTDLNKFGVIGLLHFHKGILPSHVTEFPFQKVMIKYLNYCFKSFIFNYRGVGEGGDEGGLSK